MSTDAIADVDQKLRELRERESALHEEIGKVQKIIKSLDMASARRRFTCWCVRLNDDIGIHDMGAQERANRNGLQFGLVGTTLSADRSCGVCGGKGIIPSPASEAAKASP